MKIDNTYDINADAQNILDKLIQDSDNYFSMGIKSSGDYYMVQCPFHKNGQERHPSAQFRKSDLLFYCHNCKKSYSFLKVVNHCTGKNGKAWLLDNFDGAIDGRKVQFNFKQKTKNKYISEDSLKLFNKIHPYMYKRKLTDEVIQKFNVGYDKNNNCITFPNRDEFGNIVFIATRNVNNKYFHYPQGVDKPVYGLYEIYQEKNVDKVYICESMINCLTLWGWGYYAVALNGTGSRKQLDILKKSSIRHFVIALDNDFAGNKGTEKIVKHLNNKILEKVIFTDSRDVNDLTKEEFDKCDRKLYKFGKLS